MWRYILQRIKQKLPIDKHSRIRLSLAALYAFTAWNLAMITFYYSTEQGLSSSTKIENYVQKLEKEHMNIGVMKFEGMNMINSENKKDEVDITTL